MLQILCAVVEEPVLNVIRTSKAIGIEIDESTDVSVKKQLDIHIRYINYHVLNYIAKSLYIKINHIIHINY